MNKQINNNNNNTIVVVVKVVIVITINLKRSEGKTLKMRQFHGLEV